MNREAQAGIMPRVSVIIPTYNQASYLSEAVESALAQSYQDLEVIVIDDGSTDNTPEVASGFPPGVIYIRQENQGVSTARNNGIEMAKGEYLAFLDSDDIMLEGALQKSVDFLDQHPEAGFCYGQVYRMDDKGRTLRLIGSRGAKTSCIRDGKEQIALMLFRGDITPSTVLARRFCFEEVGLFNTTLHIGEDIDMWLRLAMRYSVGYIAEPLAKYRVHPQSATIKGNFEALESSQTAFVKRALDGVEFGPRYKHLRRKAYFGLYCYLSEEAARRGHRATGFRYLLKALKASPGQLLRADGAAFSMTVARGFLPRWLRSIIVRVLIILRLR